MNETLEAPMTLRPSASVPSHADPQPASWPRWLRWFAPSHLPPALEERPRPFDPLQVPPIVLLR